MKTNPPATTIIELNGPPERVELGLLVFMAPLWGIGFPVIGLNGLPYFFEGTFFSGVILFWASFLCLLRFLHLKNSRFSFERNGIRLPGVDHRLLPYPNLKRIYLEKDSPALLAVEYEYVPLESVFKKHRAAGPLVVQLFEIQRLSEDAARQLSTLFSSKLSSCDLSADVHDKLVNWKPKTAELAENKEFDLTKWALKYLVRCSEVCGRIWLIGWAICAVIAYPLCINCMVNPEVGTQLQAAIWANCLQAAGFLGSLLRMTHK